MSRNVNIQRNLDSDVVEGKLFTAVASDAALADAGIVNILIRTPASPLVKLRTVVSSDVKALLSLFEDTTTSADGSAMTLINRNRNAGAATVLGFTGPTITGDGTALGAQEIQAGSSRGDHQWLLAPSTDYLLRYTNNSGGAANMSLAFEVVEG